MSSSGTSPRIALLGNTANCLVPVARALREAGMAAELFVDDRAPVTARPEAADPTLAEAGWIRRGRWFAPSTALAPWRSPVVPELRRFDLILVSGPGPAFAQWSGRPFVWWVSGADLTAVPFPWAFRHLHASWVRRLGAVPLAVWQRRAARRADAIWVQSFRPFREAVARLRLSSPPVSQEYLPLIVDLPEVRSDAVCSPGVTAARDRMLGARLAIFHPTRLHITSTPAERRAGQWKGNDRLFEGVAELVRRGHDDVVVVLVESSSNRDADLARKLVNDLGIDANVHWARPTDPGGFSRDEMLALYDAADVVADEFAAGWFGFVALEGMAMGRPVVTHLDAEAMQQLYPGGHPMVSCLEAGDLADRLQELFDPDLRQRLGERGRQWVAEHHSPQAAARTYVRAVSQALGAPS